MNVSSNAFGATDMVYKDRFFVIAMLNCILSGGLGTGLTFVEGWGYNKFNPAWIIGAGIIIFGIFALPVIDFINRKSASIYRRGIYAITGGVAFSYLFTAPGINTFIVAPMNIWLRITGLIFGIGGNIVWCIMSVKACNMNRNNPEFLSAIYVDHGDYFSYSTYTSENVLKKVRFKKSRFKFNLWLPIYLLIPILPLYPLTFALRRMLEPIIGDVGFEIFIGFVYIPFSLCLNAFLITVFYTYFYSPMKLTRETGKPVYLSDYWGGPEKPYPGAK